jgi:hypothetical protein
MPNHLAAAKRELAYPGPLAASSRGMGVRRLQEWLSLSGFGTPPDGDFGPATQWQLQAFRDASGLPRVPSLDEVTWEALTAPLARVLDTGALASTTFADATLEIASMHLDEHPVEVGGDNVGPWVRAYMDGNEGTPWKWCAGFITFVMAQAADALQVSSPFARTYSCDTLGMAGRGNGRLRRYETLDWDEAGSCQVFLSRVSGNDWEHTGFAFGGVDDVFSTIEGNSNSAGSRNGFEICLRRRSIQNKDFLLLD